MKVVLVIERRALLLSGQIMSRGEGAKRSRPKWENLWKNTLKEKYLRVAVNLRAIEALMKKEVPHRKGDQKNRRDIDLEARKTKRKSRGDIHLRHHPKAHLMTILKSKYRNNEGKEIRDFRFRVVSEEDQYKYSLPPDMAQYANVSFWYLHQRGRLNEGCSY